MSANKKLIKTSGKPTELELSVAQLFADLEQTSDVKAALRPLHLTAAREVDVKGKKTVVVFVPYRQLTGYHAIQVNLVHELEKKTGKNFVFIAQRRIIRKPNHHNKRKQQKRPMSRTVAKVHDAILEDLVFPNEIAGRRIRHKRDGSRLIKVSLDAKDDNAERKLDHFAAAYTRLTGKDVLFTINPEQRRE